MLQKLKVTSYALIILLLLVLPSQAVAQCNTQDACAAAAQAKGLILGGNGYAFSGSYGTKGCYSYNGGKYIGMAYFGTGGTEAAMGAAPAAPKYRISCGAQQPPAAPVAAQNAGAPGTELQQREWKSEAHRYNCLGRSKAPECRGYGADTVAAQNAGAPGTELQQRPTRGPGSLNCLGGSNAPECRGPETVQRTRPTQNVGRLTGRECPVRNEAERRGRVECILLKANFRIGELTRLLKDSESRAPGREDVTAAFGGCRPDERTVRCLELNPALKYEWDSKIAFLKKANHTSLESMRQHMETQQGIMNRGTGR